MYQEAEPWLLVVVRNHGRVWYAMAGTQLGHGSLWPGGTVMVDLLGLEAAAIGLQKMGSQYS